MDNKKLTAAAVGVVVAMIVLLWSWSKFSRGTPGEKPTLPDSKVNQMYSRPSVGPMPGQPGK